MRRRDFITLRRGSVATRGARATAGTDGSRHELTK
jgi:hypothetical protein